jgi:fructose 1,6-bisphosphate aldolase/phosphatase
VFGIKLTLSLIKADVGSYPGHAVIHPALIEIAQKELSKSDLLTDFYVTSCGDDLHLMMTHRHGADSPKIHRLAWRIFERATQKAKKLKLYGAGQDLLAEAFTGTVKGSGPGVAEMEFEERPAEPIVIFMADKTSAGSWNLPLYKTFADPFNTAGLVIAPALHRGFEFEVHDVVEGKRIRLSCPEEAYSLLALIGATDRYVIKAVYSKDGEIVAVTSTQKLSLIAGRYVGKDDPVCAVRCQKNFPAVGEVLEPYATPLFVKGWMRGSHVGCWMPVSQTQAKCTRFDGLPLVVSLGFQISKGKLIGPVDLFDSPMFDEVRERANELADCLRNHGPFEPHRLPPTELEYTTLPQIQQALKDRWESI